MKPPIREVLTVTDFEGPRGGTMHALTLSCKHWVVYRKLPRKMEVPCVGCLVEGKIEP